MGEREISEKELVFEMLEESELDLVLKVFNESPKNKNVAFKKMKVRQHLNGIKTKKNRLTPFDFLEEQLAYDSMKSLSLEKMLRIFNNPESEMPNVVKYFTLRHYHPGFFKEHYETIKNNVLNQRFFLTDIQIFQTEEKLRDYYLETFGFEKEAQDAYLDILINWYEEHVGSLKDSYELVKDWGLCEFDTKRRQLTEFNETGLMLAMLKEGTLDGTLKEIFLQHCIHDCLVEANIQSATLLKEKTDALKLEIETLEQTNKEYKKAIKDKEQELKLLKKEKQAEWNQMNQNWEMKLNQLEETHRKEQSLWDEKEAVISQMTAEIATLEATLQSQKELAMNYKWALQADYTELGIVVFHKSQLFYAKQVFPDIQFVTNVDQIDLKKPIRVILIQKYGLSHQQRRQVQLFAQTQGVELKELEGREEREQIIVLSNYLAKQDITLN